MAKVVSNRDIFFVKKCYYDEISSTFHSFLRPRLNSPPPPLQFGLKNGGWEGGRTEHEIFYKIARKLGISIFIRRLFDYEQCDSWVRKTHVKFFSDSSTRCLSKGESTVVHVHVQGIGPT